jgi:DNA-binding transcriptional regulator GbsR (MarR family)
MTIESNTTATDAKTSFVEKLAICGEEDGLPRIAGRLIGFLMMHEQAYSLDDLAEALQISKASVSTNARMLEDKGILVRTSSPGDRRDYYEIAPGHFEKFFQNAQRKVQRFLDLVEEALVTLPSSERVPRHRLKESRLFYQFMLTQLAEYQVKWREVLREAEQNGLLDEPVVKVKESNPSEAA